MRRRAEASYPAPIARHVNEANLDFPSVPAICSGPVSQKRPTEELPDQCTQSREIVNQCFMSLCSAVNFMQQYITGTMSFYTIPGSL